MVKTANYYRQHVNSATLMLLFAVAVLGVFYYLSFLLNPHNIGNWAMYGVVVGSELLVIIQILFQLWTILAGRYNPRDFHYFNAQKSLFGLPVSSNRAAELDYQHHAERNIAADLYIKNKLATIECFITVYGEPLDIIERTALATRNIVGNHITTILDDGKSDEVRLLAQQLNIRYLRRETNENAKAGNVNYGLSQSVADYFAIFDADHVPDPSFLYETMPFFQSTKVAFVQTPQNFTNLDNLVSRGTSYAQSLFYQLIQPGKNRFNAAFFVGTNAVFSRVAIESVGGIAMHSNSEDIWTSLRLHENGYRSIYIPDILVNGQAPDTIVAYSKQQLRWATGGFEILLHYRKFRSKLHVDQKLQYLSTASFYLLGLATAVLVLSPVVTIFFGISPINAQVSVSAWAKHYLAFYGMQYTIAYYAMNGFKWQAPVLSIASFPIYVKAFWNAVRGKRETWNVTNSLNSHGKKKPETALDFASTQIVLLLLFIATEAIGLTYNNATSYINTALIWNAINILVFATFVGYAIKEHFQMRARRIVSKKTQSAISLITQKQH